GLPAGGVGRGRPARDRGPLPWRRRPAAPGAGARRGLEPRRGLSRAGCDTADSGIEAAGVNTLAYRWYVDPDVLALERERVFSGTWQSAGDVGRIDEPGSYCACRAGGVPIVAGRARAGELRAFVHVCRCRGAEVVAGAGPC